MTEQAQANPVYIGWDVGGWNCDKNRTSRDALVILDSELAIVGKPWRGNLRRCTAEADTTAEWIDALFGLCQARPPAPCHATMAIDTPLGFPADFMGVVAHRKWVEPPGSSGLNPYLFRSTERWLFERGWRPLSAIKDMIGSQATKGMHTLAKFAPVVERCGVWTDGAMLRAVETYPTVARGGPTVKGMLQRYPRLEPDDVQDALVCAVVAALFATDDDSLEPPGMSVPPSEGWIWVPRDGLDVTDVQKRNTKS